MRALAPSIVRRHLYGCRYFYPRGERACVWVEWKVVSLERLTCHRQTDLLLARINIVTQFSLSVRAFVSIGQVEACWLGFSTGKERCQEIQSCPVGITGAGQSVRASGLLSLRGLLNY